MTTWELIASRLREGSLRNSRSDPYHLALVLEGGGMRGVASIGLAAGLAEAGLSQAFDSVHGSSAGACAAAYFAAGQPDLGGSIYFEDINNSRFISVGRAVIGRPIMDLEYLVGEVMVLRKPLDTDKLVEQPGYMHIVLTDADTGVGVDVSEFSSADDLLAALHASACIPIVAGRSVEFHGRRYVDGGIVQQVALDSARASGATHVLALMTRKLDRLRRKERSVSRSFELGMMSLLYPRALADAYKQRAVGINRTIDQVTGRAPLDGVELAYMVPPDDAPQLDRLTRDGAKLKASFEQCRGYAAERVRQLV